MIWFGGARLVTPDPCLMRLGEQINLNLNQRLL